ncbi:MAG: vitamin B12 dependent-methionine synthase activation domain-containing protein [Phycisphaerae bacterium]
MSEILTFTIDEAVPLRDEVFAAQGIPAGAVVEQSVDELYRRALDLFARAADAAGIVLEMPRQEFASVYQGQGKNEPHTPVGDIINQADSLALFAVTVGQRIGRQIGELFRENDYALGCMLDSVASVSADVLAGAAESTFRSMLSSTNRLPPGCVVLRYSPGYCGWDISGQRKLFERLRPERIGISLSPECLMKPLKSVSGVIIAAQPEIHDFSPDYSFCTECLTRGCRERIRALHTKRA